MTNVSVSAFGNANGGVVAGIFETRWRIKEDVGIKINVVHPFTCPMKAR